MQSQLEKSLQYKKKVVRKQSCYADLYNIKLHNGHWWPLYSSMVSPMMQSVHTVILEYFNIKE